MQGATILSMREAMGMSPAQFADILGVHPTTLGRWERSGKSEATLDPRSFQLLTNMHERLFSNRDLVPGELGKTLIKALLVSGALFAGYKLLDAMFKDEG